MEFESDCQMSESQPLNDTWVHSEKYEKFYHSF